MNPSLLFSRFFDLPLIISAFVGFRGIPTARGQDVPLHCANASTGRKQGLAVRPAASPTRCKRPAVPTRRRAPRPDMTKSLSRTRQPDGRWSRDGKTAGECTARRWQWPRRLIPVRGGGTPIVGASEAWQPGSVLSLFSLQRGSAVWTVSARRRCSQGPVAMAMAHGGHTTNTFGSGTAYGRRNAQRSPLFFRRLRQ